MLIIRRRLFDYLLLFLLGLANFNPAFGFVTQGGNIFDGNGKQIAINGVAWIGFQDSNFLGGLWNLPFNPIGSQSGVVKLLTEPWNVPGSNITSPNKGVSFKSLRLPIQPGIWRNVSTVQQQPFNFAVTDVNNPLAGNGPFCDWTKGADQSGHCLVTKSAPALLTATINEFAKQNVLIMLDFHHRPGLGDNFRDGTVVASDYSLKNYYDDIASFVKGAPSNILGIDIFNEPHQLYWYQPNNQVSPPQPAWINVIAAAAAAVYDNNQSVLLFVEGPGGTAGNDAYDPVYSMTAPICLPASTKVDNPSVIGLVNDPVHCPNTSAPMRVVNIGVNWGENFRSLIDTTKSVNGVGAFNVALFRNNLIQAIQANNFSTTNPTLIANWLLGSNNDGNGGHIVFAPHLYGSEVAGWQSDPNDSVIRFDWNFGFLLNSGFPFVVGELGYDVQMPATGGEDFFVQSVAPYLISKKLYGNLFFWTFNNSDFPVGLRTDDSGWGLFPWKEQDLYNLYNFIPPVQTFGKLCVTVPAPSGYTGSAMPVVTASGSQNYVFSLTSFNTPLCINNIVTGTYSLSGSTLTNTNGLNYLPAQSYSASVTANAETDVTIQYVQQPTGILQIGVTGSANCAISPTTQFTLSYTMGSISKQVVLTGTTPVSLTLPVGTYSISVTPSSLPNNAQCVAQYNNSVSVTANTTTQEAINYTAVTPPPPTGCTITASCSTWGTPGDSWAGSSCNLYINAQTPLTKPTIVTMITPGISSLTGVWNATATLSNGILTMNMNDPVNVLNIGFNANGIISLPKTAKISNNGQNINCTVQ